MVCPRDPKSHYVACGRRYLGSRHHSFSGPSYQCHECQQIYHALYFLLPSSGRSIPSGWDWKKRSAQRGSHSLEAPRTALGDGGYGVLEENSVEDWEGVGKKP